MSPRCKTKRVDGYVNGITGYGAHYGVDQPTLHRRGEIDIWIGKKDDKKGPNEICRVRYDIPQVRNGMIALATAAWLSGEPISVMVETGAVGDVEDVHPAYKNCIVHMSVGTFAGRSNPPVLKPTNADPSHRWLAKAHVLGLHLTGETACGNDYESSHGTAYIDIVAEGNEGEGDVKLQVGVLPGPWGGADTPAIRDEPARDTIITTMAMAMATRKSLNISIYRYAEDNDVARLASFRWGDDFAPKGKKKPKERRRKLR